MSGETSIINHFDVCFLCAQCTHMYCTIHSSLSVICTSPHSLPLPYWLVSCSTVSSILGAWLDQYSEDFWSPPQYSCLHHLMSYLHQHFPGSDLERRALNLLALFHRRHRCEPDLDGESQDRVKLVCVSEISGMMGMLMFIKGLW